MKYIFRPSAEKQFARLNPNSQSAIVKKLTFFAATPNPLSFAKRLSHLAVGQYRFRIGDYRVIFDVSNDTIVVLAIGHRKEIYK